MAFLRPYTPSLTNEEFRHVTVADDMGPPPDPEDEDEDDDDGPPAQRRRLSLENFGD